MTEIDNSTNSTADPNNIKGSAEVEKKDLEKIRKRRKKGEQSESEKAFRINAKNFALTWPQCNTPLQDMLDRIKTKWPTTLHYALVAHEDHADGTPHRHVLIQLMDKHDCKGQGFLDFIAGQHGNYKPAHQPDGWRRYCLNLLEDPDGKPNPHVEYGAWKKNNWKESIAKATTQGAAAGLAHLAATEPRTVLTNFNSVQAAIEHFGKREVEAFKPYAYNTFLGQTSGMTKWVADESWKTVRARCLVLIGPSRLGKTEWARSLGKHMYWKNMTNLSEWDQSAEYIVLDDIDFKFIAGPKVWLTCNGQATVTDRYCKKKTVIFNKPVIYLTNGEDLKDWEHLDYWQANCVFVTVKHKLWEALAPLQLEQVKGKGKKRASEKEDFESDEQDFVN